MRGLAFSLTLVVMLVFLFWAVTEALGYDVALTSSLILSVLLTLLLNLVLGVLRRR